MKDETLSAAGVLYASLAEILQTADVLSLHCPLTLYNHHLINREAIALMKSGVMLINTSRGGLINTEDAIAGLKTDRISYLGIDVYEQEEKLFFKDLSGSIIEDDTIQRLMSFPNVLVTGHQAFFTTEALAQIAEITLRSIDLLAKGDEPDHSMMIR